jgi:hypothetical protein
VRLRDETALIILECVKASASLVECCSCVVARLTSVVTQDTNVPRPDLISLAVDELVRYILIANERNADECYRLRQEIRRSNEWLALTKALAEKPTTLPSQQSASPVRPTKKRKGKRRRTGLLRQPTPHQAAASVSVAILLPAREPAPQQSASRVKPAKKRKRRPKGLPGQPTPQQAAEPEVVTAAMQPLGPVQEQLVTQSQSQTKPPAPTPLELVNAYKAEVLEKTGVNCGREYLEKGGVQNPIRV